MKELMFYNKVTIELESALSFLAIIISLVSLWLSWYLSDKYGLKNRIYEKRLTAVLDLIEAVKSLNFNGFLIDEPRKSRFIGGIDTTKFKIYFKDYYEDFKHQKIYFARPEYDLIFAKLNNLQANPYLDKKIVKSLDFLNTICFYIEDSSTIKEGAILTIKYNYKGDLVNPKSFPTFKDYFDNMENVIKVSTKWLKSKSRLSDDFNI